MKNTFKLAQEVALTMSENDDSISYIDALMSLRSESLSTLAFFKENL